MAQKIFKYLFKVFFLSEGINRNQYSICRQNSFWNLLISWQTINWLLLWLFMDYLSHLLKDIHLLEWQNKILRITVSDETKTIKQEFVTFSTFYIN